MSAPLHFLVVEDNDFQRRLVVRYLQTLGAASVSEAADGRAALDLLEQGLHADFIVCDVQMPGMDGMEFLRHLKHAECRASIVLASALERRLLGSIATMTEAYGLRLLGIVEKPLTPGKLLDLIGKHHCAGPDLPRPAPQPKPDFVLDEILQGIQDGQFEAQFQPKIEIATDAVTGMEALARWRHPQHGLVPPQRFIPVLEAASQMDPLTHEMLRLATRAQKAWSQAGHELSVGVNLSLASLDDVRLAESLSRIVLQQGVAPSNVVFELTETAASTSVASALENLARMRMWGFGLSIDDYGTGYASMQQLARIAFNELKIDRAFVTNAADDPAARVILSSSLDMARRLGITAVAEGVETEQDWQLLKEMECAMAQGYLISRPMHAATCIDWLDDWARMR